MGVILLTYLPGILGICVVVYLVFARRQKELAYTAFCLSLIQIALWLFFQMISLLVPDEMATFMVNLSIIFANFMVAFFMLFALTYQAQRSKNRSRKSTLILFLPAVILSLFSLTPLVIRSVANHGLKQEIYQGPLYIVQTVYIIMYILISLIVLGRRIPMLKGSRRSAQILLMVAFAVSVAINLVANYVFGLPQDLTQYLLPTSIFITVAIIGYAIARHGLFDIRLAAVRTLAYGLSLLAMAAIYFGLAYLASATLFKGTSTTGVSMSPVNILLALLLAFIFQPVKHFFDRVTDRIFYHDRYNTDDLIADVGVSVTSTADLKRLLEVTAQTISQTVKAAGASFVIYRDDKSPLQIGTNGHAFLTTGEIDELRTYIAEYGSSLINVSERREEKRRHASIITVLSKRRVALAVPLAERRGVIGVLLIDEQKGSGYVKHDIRALETLTDELVVAVQNALSLQEIRDVNMHLEQRISTATKELRRSNNQLKALDETKDEFISMASHQLRTPLTSVKGYISMVLDGDVGEINPTQRKLLGEAFASSERMVHLIGDFLNVSRLQTGKFIIDQRPADLAQVVAEEIDSIDSLVTSHDMTLVYKRPKNIPIISIDEDKIRQVIMNFIDNAVYYSRPKSTIVVKLQRKGGDVVLEVHDHGIGVPVDAQKRLFTKFFRADNARRQRPDGTGVGLFLAKKVVTAQGGDIIFESTEGKGSVFGFRLPIHPKTPHQD